MDKKKKFFMWLRRSFLIAVSVLCLAMVANNQFFNNEQVGAVDVLLATIAAGCVAELLRLWKAD